jgi:hypothetical protein
VDAGLHRTYLKLLARKQEHAVMAQQMAVKALRIPISWTAFRASIAALSGWAALAVALWAGYPGYRQFEEAQRGSAVQAASILRNRLTQINSELGLVERASFSDLDSAWNYSVPDFNSWYGQHRKDVEQVRKAEVVLAEIKETPLKFSDVPALGFE